MPQHVLDEQPAERPWKPNAAETSDVLLWSELAYHGPPVESLRSPAMVLEGTAEISANSSIDQLDPRGTEPETALEDLCQNLAVPIVVGYSRAAQGSQQRYNSAAFIDPTEGFQGIYDKIGLVPWTEFTPLDGLTSRKGRRFTHGTNYPIFKLRGEESGRTFRFALAICYDVAFAPLFRRYMRNAEGAPDFFLVCSSERSDMTGRMSRHVLSLAKVRAIECRRPLVRNVHRGFSGRIDSTGRLCDVDLPSLLQSPALLEAIPIDRRSTLFVLWGDWIPRVTICALLIAAALRVLPTRLRSIEAGSAS